MMGRDGGRAVWHKYSNSKLTALSYDLIGTFGELTGRVIFMLFRLAMPFKLAFILRCTLMVK